MKHKSVLLVSVLMVAASLYLAVHTNTNALHDARVQVAAAAKQAQQNVATRHKLQSQLNAANAEVSQLEAQCQLGVRDYQLLSTTERVKATLPICAAQPSVK